MPQSTWYASAMGTIDGVFPDTTYAGGFDLGFFYAGGTKGFRLRVIIGFDLRIAPAEGRTLAPTDAVASATLILNATVVIGPTGWGAKAARVSRADWDDATATWNNYKTASAWTAPGGDIASPPADVAFTSPATAGDFSITGMQAFATDALANRAGLVLVRLKPDAEADPNAVSTYFSGGDLNTSIAPRLVVTYTSADPTPINRPNGHAIGATRPARSARPSRAEVGAPPSQTRRGERPPPHHGNRPIKHNITPIHET